MKVAMKVAMNAMSAMIPTLVLGADKRTVAKTRRNEKQKWKPN
jgi:hypothetical protein